MWLYEHEAKEVVKGYGVLTPIGCVASTPNEVKEIAERFKGPVVIKAQVPVAGRGKVGGVRFADGFEEAYREASKLLGGSVGGFSVKKVLVEEKVEVDRELYLAVAVDRSVGGIIIIACSMGGVDVEEVAKASPGDVVRWEVDPFLGLRDFEARNIAGRLGFSGPQLMKLSSIIKGLYECAVKYDAELLEVNPLALSKDGRMVALDVRLNIDDNALYRQGGFRDRLLEEGYGYSSQELKAFKKGLTYIELDGDIGVVGNGAGLVMATLDLIDLYGGKPAAFIDIGGGASAEVMEAALEILLANPRVKVILVNILGGITRCDEVADGVIRALHKLKVEKPTVIRLSGVAEEEGRGMLMEEGLTALSSSEEAAKKAVEMALG